MSETSSPVARHPWRRLMAARDPEERHRSATPLELLFDLCFVVAVSRAALQMSEQIGAGHAATGVLSYLVVFFAIWWAWMNFTWFASAYDTDDVLYRILTVVQMAGVLVMSVGIPALFARFDVTVIIVGYVIMRLPLVAQWLRAAREDPDRRATCRTYALGLVVVQVLWVALIVVPAPARYVGLVVLIVAEVAIPIWAESRGRPTTWHPEHITERYGLLTLIVLGEVILGITNAFGAVATSGELSPDLIMLAVGGLLLVFGLWWTYFLGGDDSGLSTLRIALTWGYGHYLVFASIAALGAGLEAAVGSAERINRAGPITAGFAVAIPVVVFLVVISLLRRLSWPSGTGHHGLVLAASVLVLASVALAPVELGLSVLTMGFVLVATLATYLTRARRPAGSGVATPDPSAEAARSDAT